MARTAKLDGKLMFPNDYLCAAEFNEQDVNLTMKRVTVEDLRIKDGGKESKHIVYFEETKKKLVLNTTNAETIAAVWGPNANEWGGKRITLYPTKVSAFGGMHDAIRIRDKAPAAKQADGGDPVMFSDADIDAGMGS